MTDVDIDSDSYLCYFISECVNFFVLDKTHLFWGDEQSKCVCFTGCTFIGSSCLLEFAKTTAETNGPETKHYVHLSLPFLPPEGMVLK